MTFIIVPAVAQITEMHYSMSILKPHQCCWKCRNCLLRGYCKADFLRGQCQTRLYHHPTPAFKKEVNMELLCRPILQRRDCTTESRWNISVWSFLWISLELVFQTPWVECRTPNYLIGLLNQYWLLNTIDYLTRQLNKQWCFWNRKNLALQFSSTCFGADRKIWRVWWSINNENDYPSLKSQENSCPKINSTFCQSV